MSLNILRTFQGRGKLFFDDYSQIETVFNLILMHTGKARLICDLLFMTNLAGTVKRHTKGVLVHAEMIGEVDTPKSSVEIKDLILESLTLQGDKGKPVGLT